MRSSSLIAAVVVFVACRSEHSDRAAKTDDPWAGGPRRSTAPEPPKKPRPPRPLELDGAVDAPPELLATPLPGYADPKVGDWRAYRHITDSEKLGTFHATAIAEVIAVDQSTVTIEFRGRLDETGEQRSDGADIFPRAFTVNHELHRHHSEWAISSVALVDDPQVIDSHSFASKKLSAAYADPMLPGKETHVEVWLSPEVPAGGEVSVREVQKMPAMTISSTSTLIGYGDLNHTTWGTKPTGL